MSTCFWKFMNMDKHKPTSFLNMSSFVTFRLSKLQSSLNAQATSILKQNSDLTLVEWRIIQVVRMFEDMTSSMIVDHVQMDKGQLSRKIKGMIEKGLLKSERNQDDKRVQKLILTEKALSISDMLMPTMEKRQKNLLSDCLLYTSPSPRDLSTSRMPSSA